MQSRQFCTYSVRMPVTLRERLDRLAAAQDRRPSQVIRRLIRVACAEIERENFQREAWPPNPGNSMISEV